MPAEVVAFVNADVDTWGELLRYASAYMAATEHKASISKVGAALRSNGGRPLWK
jgi:hypothetical protein